MSEDIGPTPEAGSSTDLTTHRNSPDKKSERVQADADGPSLKSGEKTSDDATGTKVSSNGPTARDQLRGPEKCWANVDYSKSRQDVEEAITECVKAKYGETLVADMEGAQLLLSYVTRNGLQEEKKVDDEIIQTLIASWQRLRNGTFDCEKEEARFRKCYGVLAKAAAPVTVSSLRDSTMSTGIYRRWFIKPEQRPIAEIACLRYRNYAIVVLVLLLAAQIYWTATSSVLSRTDAIIAELAKAPTKEYYLAQEAARIAALKNANQSLGTGSAPGQAAAGEVKTDKNQLTLDELVAKVGELNANYSILEKFLRPFSWFFFKPDKKGTDTSQKNDAAKQPAGKETSANQSSSPLSDAIFDPSSFQNESASIAAIAGQIIDVMQKWLLPLLYGALGAMVFVVRTLSVQARDRLFRKEALVSLILRVFLGMISGLAIGWFWTVKPQGATPGGPMSVSTLSPFALAFVAGYGVELFFALLDKIVSTFTNKS